MHVLENTEPSFWREENIEECFYCLFDHVIEAVQSKQCPHFWLTGINFFEELTDRDVKSLSKLLTKIRRDPSPYIDDSFVSKDTCRDEIEQGEEKEQNINERIPLETLV